MKHIKRIWIIAVFLLPSVAMVLWGISSDVAYGKMDHLGWNPIKWNWK